MREMRAATTGTTALVPTMGALHEGHLSLIREARKKCETLVVSLFVNPTQFGPAEDFNRYPRDETRDADLASAAGADVLFAPSPEEMYPRKTTVVSVKDIPDRWEGALRPGHFDGVATVVCKLFNIVSPDLAIFGLKDLQQCAVIRRMVEDLDLPVELAFGPTVREADGLALSSRNVYLSAENRRLAPAIYRELQRCQHLFITPGVDAEAELKNSAEALEAMGMAVDYFDLVSTQDLTPRSQPVPGDSIIAAVRLGGTRLIDNVQLA